MSIGIYFAAKGMTAEKYAEVHEQLAEIGQGHPQGRLFHAGFNAGDGPERRRTERRSDGEEGRDQSGEPALGDRP